MQYPLWDFFDTCGCVEARQEGLYLHFSAQMEMRSGFWHLYHSCEETVTRLGLFCPDGENMICQGRISLRSLNGNWEKGSFIMRNVPFSPLKDPLDGGYCPPNAALVQKNGRRFVLIEHKDRLPEEIMPYFCFLAPGEICGIACLGFEVDSQGKPVFPELMAE